MKPSLRICRIIWSIVTLLEHYVVCDWQSFITYVFVFYERRGIPGFCTVWNDSSVEE
jgi:hypothetical protein